MDSSDWSNGIRYLPSDTRSDIEFRRGERDVDVEPLPRTYQCPFECTDQILTPCPCYLKQCAADSLAGAYTRPLFSST